MYKFFFILGTIILTQTAYAEEYEPTYGKLLASTDRVAARFDERLTDVTLVVEWYEEDDKDPDMTEEADEAISAGETGDCFKLTFDNDGFLESAVKLEDKEKCEDTPAPKAEQSARPLIYRN